MVDGEPWFVAKDACDVLGISKYRDAVAQLAADERASTAVDTLGGRQRMAVVNEPGLYALMFISRSPKVRPFQRWVTHEVLPQIRRTGEFHPSRCARRLSWRSAGRAPSGT
ncbi:Bro-N domain-containing protein [Microbacterium sp. SORGH_AS_0888]|uniref:BRO-N domain-containing protein n=1 Tax=Microbacterium sp. SORGH_AS_0888 TaxID=3041791 RepID=UPI00358E5955